MLRKLLRHPVLLAFLYISLVLVMHKLIAGDVSILINDRLFIKKRSGTLSKITTGITMLTASFSSSAVQPLQPLRLVLTNSKPKRADTIIMIEATNTTTQNDTFGDAKRSNLISPDEPRKVVCGNKTLIVDPVPGGPGDMGKPIMTKEEELMPEQRHLYNRGIAKNDFDEYLSDQISLRRRLPDMRHPDCLKQSYLKNLPTVSVIIVFHEEALSVLLRTVHSVLDRSPADILHEIILVDDFSKRSHTNKPLEEYVSTMKKVKIVRASKREGLIRARLIGGKHASGEVLVYQDSHCECTVGWLPALIDPIARNNRTVTVPVIPVIGTKDFAFENSLDVSKNIYVGGFTWPLVFNWIVLPPGEKQRRVSEGLTSVDPVRTPTMAGGLFAINKNWFETLGTYDPEYDVWGGENLELSFKVWMCGGSLVTAPCSHVGHIYRTKFPYTWPEGTNYFRNCVRLAEVWLDEYKQYFYEYVPSQVKEINYGDISSRLAIRKRLQCKNFDWFMNNVWPEKFHPGKSVYSGWLRNHINDGSSDACLDSSDSQAYHGKAMRLWPCHNQRGNQLWHLTRDGELRREESCMDAGPEHIMMNQCHGLRHNQYWIYNKLTLALYHPETNKCLEVKPDRRNLLMAECSAVPQQQWQVEASGWRNNPLNN